MDMMGISMTVATVCDCCPSTQHPELQKVNFAIHLSDRNLILPPLSILNSATSIDQPPRSTAMADTSPLRQRPQGVTRYTCDMCPKQWIEFHTDPLGDFGVPIAWEGVLYAGMEVIQRCPDCKVIAEKNSADAGRTEQKAKSKKRDFEKGGYYGR